jgi:hypothetical protein
MANSTIVTPRSPRKLILRLKRKSFISSHPQWQIALQKRFELHSARAQYIYLSQQTVTFKAM